jgi:hypothetical protein
MNGKQSSDRANSDYASSDCVEVRAGSDLFRQVLELGNGKAKRWLGPMPDSGFADRAHKGTLLAAIASGQTVGYVMYDLPANQVKIRHLCVAGSAERTGVARFMVECLSARHPERRGLEAACRRDYPANGLWPRLGFRPAATRVGRSVARHPLTIWLLDHGHPDLFTVAPDGDLAALDHMVFLDLVEETAARRESSESKELRAPWIGDYVELCITDEVFHEIDRVHETAHRSALQMKADGFLNVSRGVPLNTGLEARVARLAPGADGPDHRHVARAASAGARYLVSRDDQLLRAARAIERATGVTVLRPASLIASLDGARAANRYVPQALRETELVEAAVGAVDLPDVTNSLLNNAAGERSHQLAGVVRSAVAAVDRYDVRHVRDGEGEVCGGFVRSSVGSDVAVSVLRVGGSDRLALALARQLAFDQRVSAADRGGGLVRVSDPHLPDSVAGALKQEWFTLDEDGDWVCDVRVGMVEASSILDPLEARAQGPDWERRHWPQKVIGAGIPTYMMSINVAYAEQLIDPRLAAQTLLHRQTHLGLGREHVYYRRPRNDAGIEPGARILWYVTGSAPSHPRGSLRALSTVAEVVIGGPARLYQRFARLGVYSPKQVKAAADRNGRAMAIRFVDTEPLERPIGLDELYELFEADAESFTPPQSPRRISEQMFRRLYKQSSRYGS